MASTVAPDTRFASLDGLRGVAALVVLLHHVAFAVPWFAPTYFSQDLAPEGSVIWWLAYTPLKILTAGPEAVIVFFLLSGFVLSLEPFRKPTFDWLGYYPRRIVRLYVPIIASVLLAVLLILAIPRSVGAVTGTWLEILADPRISLGTVSREATVLFETDFRINPPLWSLVWEVWFSLLLPLFVAMVLLLRRAWWIAVIVGFVASVAGMHFAQPALIYLPMFLIGVGLARGVEDLRSLANRIQSWRLGGLVWWLLTIVAVLLLVLTWLLRGFGSIDTLAAATISPTTLLGATLLLFCCAFWPGAVRALTTAPVAWLGRVSYSLYLVHVPVLLAIAFAVGDGQWWWIVVLAIPASLLVAWGFARVVEVPAHRLSRTVGALVQR